MNMNLASSRRRGTGLASASLALLLAACIGPRDDSYEPNDTTYEATSRGAVAWGGTPFRTSAAYSSVR